MKRRLIIIAFLISIVVQGQEDYTIKIGDKVLEVKLDKQYKVEVKSQTINFTISANDTLLFKDNVFSFNYPKEYKVSKMNVDLGIDQYMLMTAEGSGIIIQKYTSMNPTMMNEIVLNEVTKESVNYGFELKREDYERTLDSGDIINIDKAVLTYKDETNIYEITSMGKKDEGILVITMVMDITSNEQGEKIIDLMWNSLKYY
jgi:hypothetical protein